MALGDTQIGCLCSCPNFSDIKSQLRKKQQKPACETRSSSCFIVQFLDSGSTARKGGSAAARVSNLAGAGELKCTVTESGGGGAEERGSATHRGDADGPSRRLSPPGSHPPADGAVQRLQGPGSSPAACGRGQLRSF